MTPLGALAATWLALSPAGDRLSVAWDTPGEVQHFDARTGRLVGKGPAPAAPAGGRFRLDRFGGTVTLSAPTRTVAVCREPIDAALAQDGRSLWVACLLPEQAATAPVVAARVVVMDIATGAVRASILLPNGSTSVRGIALSRDGRWAFVTHIVARYTVHTSQLEQGWMNTNAVTVLDVQARRLHGTVLLDDVDNGAANPWAVAVSADSKRLYVTHAGTHELSAIDLPAMLERLREAGGDAVDRLSFLIDVRERIALPGKGPRALAVRGGRVWVAEYFTRTVALVENGVARPFTAAPATPMTAQRRGEMLFHDASLCMQHWQSCSSCHPDGRADGLNWDLLNDGIGNPKNTRSLVNAHRTGEAMWTAIRPSASYAVRTGMKHILFVPPSEEQAAAMDKWLESIVAVRRPGLDAASVERGRTLFFGEKAGCVACHPPPLYTDTQLHDVGTGREPQLQFKTPSLIEAWRTAPYLHDGRYATLEETIGEGNAGDRRGHTSGLSQAERRDLLAFLRSL